MSDKPSDAEVREAVVAYVRRCDFVSFAELHNRFDSFENEEHTSAIYASADDNMILWADMSDRFSGIMRDLLREKQLFVHPADPMIYMIDGRFCSLPQVKRKMRYKTPHWLPVCLRVVPMKEKKPRRAKRPVG